MLDEQQTKEEASTPVLLIAMMCEDRHRYYSPGRLYFKDNRFEADKPICPYCHQAGAVYERKP